MLIAGVEVHRFALQDRVLQLAENAQVPIAATILGKSAIRETHPLYVGLYEGAMGDADVTCFVEESDCLVLLGTFMTDLNLGIYTANLDASKCICATSEQLRIRHHHYHGVRLGDFIDQLNQRNPQPVVRPLPETCRKERRQFELDPSAPLRISRIIERLDQQIDEQTIVIADIETLCLQRPN
jgi:indolepyruvate decarboxylase